MQGKLYIPDFDGNRVLVIDQMKQMVTGEVPVGLNPTTAVLHPFKKQLFVLNTGSQNISIVNTEWDQLEDTLDLGQSPTAMSISSDGLELCVSDQQGLSIIDTQFFEIKGRIERVFEQRRENSLITGDLEENSDESELVPEEELLTTTSESAGQTLSLGREPELNARSSEELLKAEEAMNNQPTAQLETQNPMPSRQSHSLQPDVDPKLLSFPSMPDISQLPPMPDISQLPPIPNISQLPTLPNISQLPNFPSMPPSMPGNLLSGVPSFPNTFGSFLDQTTPNMMSPLDHQQLPNTETPLQTMRFKTSAIQRNRTGILNRLKKRVRKLGLPPETVRMLEKNIDAAISHIRLFIKNVRKLVRIHLLSETKAAPLILEAKKIISMTSVRR